MIAIDIDCITKLPNTITLCQTYGQLKNEIVQTAGKARIYKEPDIINPHMNSNVLFGAVFQVIMIPTRNPTQSKILRKIRIKPYTPPKSWYL